MRIKILYIILFSLIFSCKPNDQVNSADEQLQEKNEDNKYYGGIETSDSLGVIFNSNNSEELVFKGLTFNIEDASAYYISSLDNMVTASDEITEFRNSFLSGYENSNELNNSPYEFIYISTKYQTITTLDELIKVTNLLRSDFTSKFISFCYQSTPDQMIKVFCITSVEQFVIGMKISADNLHLLLKQKDNDSGKINGAFSHFVDANSTIQKINEVIALGANRDKILNDKNKANMHIRNIKNSLDENLGYLSESLNNLAIELARIEDNI